MFFLDLVATFFVIVLIFCILLGGSITFGFESTVLAVLAINLYDIGKSVNKW